MTICVNDRECVFGKIIDGCMQLSSIGKTVEEYWNLIPQIYPNIYLDHYVIMPNHLHGIIIIDMPVGAINNRPYGKLSQIIKSYKQMVTKQIRKQNNVYFLWQRSFYDHVIRDDVDFNRVREYIINNPKMWEYDENNPD